MPGRKPQYGQPGPRPGPEVVLLGIVLNVRLLVPLLLLVSLVLVLLVSLVLVVPLVLSLLLLLVQTTPGGQGPVLEVLLVVCSRGSVVRWRTISPIPVGRLYASRVNAIARIKNTVIVRRPSLRVIRIACYGYVSTVVYERCGNASTFP